jgi:hypothetical protein
MLVPPALAEALQLRAKLSTRTPGSQAQHWPDCHPGGHTLKKNPQHPAMKKQAAAAKTGTAPRRKDGRFTKPTTKTALDRPAQDFNNDFTIPE